MMGRGNGLAGRALLPLLLVCAGVVAYHNSFQGVYVLDDDKQILQNKRIASVTPLSETLSGRRPVVALTLALNKHFAETTGGKPSTWGFHLVNLCIHILAGLTLYGVVRRTMLRGCFGDYASVAPWAGLVTALIWLVHPLQTQSVTYLIQRSESLMGLFYLLTLYAVVRGTESLSETGTKGARDEGTPRRRGALVWYLIAIVFCALGMGSKGVMVTAPIVVLLFDWMFLGGSIGQVIRRRWLVYLGLAACWSVLAICGVAQGALSSDRTGSTVGFSYKGISPGDYLLTQIGVVAFYLKLALWPANLCLDRAWPAATTVREIVVPAMILVPLLVATVAGLIRKAWWGFLGAWFFIILAPTSTIVPMKDAAFEHRMYLPLAGIVALAVGAGVAAMRWLHERRGVSSGALRAWAIVVVLVVTTSAIAGTIRRNRDYHDDLTMWADVLDKSSANPRAWLGLGSSYYARDQFVEAELAFAEAARLNPTYADALYNLGNARFQLGRLDEAVDAYRKAIDIRPGYAKAHYNLANTYKKQKKYDAAIAAYRNAIRYGSGYVAAHVNLGNTLRLAGRSEEAVGEYERAIAFKPDHANAHYNLGLTLHEQGRLDEALSELESALKHDPSHQGAGKRREAVKREMGE